MGAYHARLSPSSAHRWSSCTASPGAQDGRPNTTSEASRFGTCGHQIAEECLLQGTDPLTYVGRRMLFWSGLDDSLKPLGGEDWENKFTQDDGSLRFPHGGEQVAFVDVTEEMAEGVLTYVKYVRNHVATHGGEMLVEQSVPIDHITGEEGARGTTDVAVLSGETLTIIDLKMGRGRVKAYEVVEPSLENPETGEVQPPKLQMNQQVALYALGTYREHSLFHDFKRVKAVIVQPMLNAVSEYECSIDELLALGEWLSKKAEETRVNPEFQPSSDNCFFCKARFDCHARNAEVLSAAIEGFDDVETAKPKVIQLPQLGDMWNLLPMIRAWADDIEARVQAELEAGRRVHLSDGQYLKLVEGKQGNKQWKDERVVEQMLKKDFRLRDDLVYNQKLITPTQAEKIAITTKGKRPENDPKKYAIGKVQWQRLAEHIVRADAKPKIVVSSDPRPEIQRSEPTAEDDGSDLFN